MENHFHLLLKLLEKTGQTSGSTQNRTGEALRKHGEVAAERIVRRAVKILGLLTTADAMAKLPTSDERKVVLAAWLRDRSSVGNFWIARRLSIGHSGSVNRLIGACRISGELLTIKKLANALDET